AEADRAPPHRGRGVTPHETVPRGGPMSPSTAPDAPTAAAPVAAATVVLLRDGPGGLEVLLIERNSASRLLAGMHVFPGGQPDPDDSDPGRLERMGAPLVALHAALGEPDLGETTSAGLFVAAARETYEEAAILLARRTDRPSAETFVPSPSRRRAFW